MKNERFIKALDALGPTAEQKDRMWEQISKSSTKVFPVQKLVLSAACLLLFAVGAKLVNPQPAPSSSSPVAVEKAQEDVGQALPPTVAMAPARPNNIIDFDFLKQNSPWKASKLPAQLPVFGYTSVPTDLSLQNLNMQLSIAATDAVAENFGASTEALQGPVFSYVKTGEYEQDIVNFSLRYVIHYPDRQDDTLYYEQTKTVPILPVDNVLERLFEQNASLKGKTYEVVLTYEERSLALEELLPVYLFRVSGSEEIYVVPATP